MRRALGFTSILLFTLITPVAPIATLAARLRMAWVGTAPSNSTFPGRVTMTLIR